MEFSPVAVRDGVVAANRSGFVQPFTRKLDGGGDIEHVINGIGGPVSAAGQGSYVCHGESRLVQFTLGKDRAEFPSCERSARVHGIRIAHSYLVATGCGTFHRPQRRPGSLDGTLPYNPSCAELKEWSTSLARRVVHIKTPLFFQNRLWCQN